MTSIRTIIHNRRIDVPAPDGLPDGMEVMVQLVPVCQQEGLVESEWDDSPEGIVDWLAWLDSLEPLLFTEPEQAELEAHRRARKEWEKSQFSRRAD